MEVLFVLFNLVTFCTKEEKVLIKSLASWAIYLGSKVLLKYVKIWEICSETHFLWSRFLDMPDISLGTHWTEKSSPGVYKNTVEVHSKNDKESDATKTYKHTYSDL